MLTQPQAEALAERLLSNLVHYRKGGGHRSDDAQMIAQELQRIDEEARTDQRPTLIPVRDKTLATFVQTSRAAVHLQSRGAGHDVHLDIVDPRQAKAMAQNAGTNCFWAKFSRAAATELHAQLGQMLQSNDLTSCSINTDYDSPNLDRLVDVTSALQGENHAK